MVDLLALTAIATTATILTFVLAADFFIVILVESVSIL